jgi:hypothetical protein
MEKTWKKITDGKINKLMKTKFQCGKNKRYIPTLSNDGKHISTYVLRDKLTGKFISIRSVRMSSLTIINCKNLDQCEKVKMVLDKDLLDFQYRDMVLKVCDKCIEKVEDGR